MADKIINGILCTLGAAAFWALWYYGILPFDVIWKIVTGEV